MRDPRGPQTHGVHSQARRDERGARSDALVERDSGGCGRWREQQELSDRRETRRRPSTAELGGDVLRCGDGPSDAHGPAAAGANGDVERRYRSARAERCSGGEPWRFDPIRRSRSASMKASPLVSECAGHLTAPLASLVHDVLGKDGVRVLQRDRKGVARLVVLCFAVPDKELPIVLAVEARARASELQQFAGAVDVGRTRACVFQHRGGVCAGTRRPSAALTGKDRVPSCLIKVVVSSRQAGGNRTGGRDVVVARTYRRRSHQLVIGRDAESLVEDLPTLQSMFSAHGEQEFSIRLGRAVERSALAHKELAGVATPVLAAGCRPLD